MCTYSHQEQQTTEEVQTPVPPVCLCNMVLSPASCVVLRLLLELINLLNILLRPIIVVGSKLTKQESFVPCTWSRHWLRPPNFFKHIGHVLPIYFPCCSQYPVESQVAGGQRVFATFYSTTYGANPLLPLNSAEGDRHHEVALRPTYRRMPS